MQGLEIGAEEVEAGAWKEESGEVVEVGLTDVLLEAAEELAQEGVSPSDCAVESPSEDWP
jgi:hypothetical protein